MVRNCGLILVALLLMASPAAAAVATSNNNFTILDLGAAEIGVHLPLDWNGNLNMDA